jgi:hypothetical protein
MSYPCQPVGFVRESSTVTQMYRDSSPAFILPAILGGPVLIDGAVLFFRDAASGDGQRSPWPLRLSVSERDCVSRFSST